MHFLSWSLYDKISIFIHSFIHSFILVVIAYMLSKILCVFFFTFEIFMILKRVIKETLVLFCFSDVLGSDGFYSVYLLELVGGSQEPRHPIPPPPSPPRALYACKVFTSLKQEGGSLPHRLQKGTVEQPVLWSLFCAKRRALLGKGYLPVV